MRGKLEATAEGQPLPRIIPAHAGQTVAVILQKFSKTDHPRACGANGKGVSLDKDGGGSSPRMRGKRSRA